MFYGCNSKPVVLTGDELIHINRFDSALFVWIDSDDSVALKKVENDYPQMFDILGKALFETRSEDASVFYDNLINYYSEPTLKALYRDAVTRFSADSAAFVGIRNELSFGFMQMKRLFASMQIPDVYLHVSGLQQNVIVADNLISCSIDKYMGADYPLYRDFFYDYQRKNMNPERVAKDCLNVWLKSEFPYKGKNNVLLDRMIYEGKIIYLLTQTGYDYNYQNLTSQTDKEYEWLLDYEKTLWTTIIERKHLYTPDMATTSKYFQPSPSTFISNEAPGNPGYFIGYRIVEKYMKKTKSSCEELMKNGDAQDILKKSEYKP
jgi:hypothetical protein